MLNVYIHMFTYTCLQICSPMFTYICFTHMFYIHTFAYANCSSMFTYICLQTRHICMQIAFTNIPSTCDYTHKFDICSHAYVDQHIFSHIYMLPCVFAYIRLQIQLMFMNVSRHTFTRTSLYTQTYVSNLSCLCKCV